METQQTHHAGKAIFAGIILVDFILIVLFFRLPTGTGAIFGKQLIYTENQQLLLVYMNNM